MPVPIQLFKVIALSDSGWILMKCLDNRLFIVLCRFRAIRSRGLVGPPALPHAHAIHLSCGSKKQMLSPIQNFLHFSSSSNVSKIQYVAAAIYDLVVVVVKTSVERMLEKGKNFQQGPPHCFFPSGPSSCYSLKKWRGHPHTIWT